MQIFVQASSGETFTVFAEASDTIACIKAIVHNKFGILRVLLDMSFEGSVSTTTTHCPPTTSSVALHWCYLRCTWAAASALDKLCVCVHCSVVLNKCDPIVISAQCALQIFLNKC